MKKIFIIIYIIIIFIFVYSCKTTDVVTFTTTSLNTVSSSTTTTITTVQTTTTTTTTTLYVQVKIDERQHFVVDLKKMQETEIREMIRNLFNSIEEKISQGDFNGWYNSISEAYKNDINNSKKLKDMSDTADYLKSKNIILKSAKDYFIYVVVQARENITLKFYGYKYIDEKTIKVYLEEKGNLYYNFVKEGEYWKLDR